MTSMYSTLFGAGNYFGVGYAQKNIGAAMFGLLSTATGTDEYGNPTEEFGYREGTLAGGYAHAFGPCPGRCDQALCADAQTGLRRNGDIGALIALHTSTGSGLAQSPEI